LAYDQQAGELKIVLVNDVEISASSSEQSKTQLDKIYRRQW